MRLFTVIAILLLLSGCAQKQLSRDESLAVNARSEQARVRTYSGIPKEKIIAACEKALKASDSKYEIVRHTEDGFYAKRRWMMYVILAAASGEHHWKLSVIEQGDNSIAELKGWMGEGVSMAPFPISSAGANETNIFIAPSLYNLLFARIDYFLGLRKDWLTCDAAQLTKDPLEVSDPFGPLCTMVRATDPTEP